MLDVDTRAFGRFARALKQTEPELAKGLRTALRAAGELVASDARERASYSRRIPGSIRVRTTGLTVSVVAGGAKAPNAGPLEHGGREGTFRHPVFGNRGVWVDQPGRPFLHPALYARRAVAVSAVEAALTGVLHKLGGDF